MLRLSLYSVANPQDPTYNPELVEAYLKYGKEAMSLTEKMTKEKLSRRTRMWLENHPDLPEDLKKELATEIEKQEKKVKR